MPHKKNRALSLIICWSRPYSRKIAFALRDFIGNVFKGAKRDVVIELVSDPFGEPWLPKLAGVLKKARVAIVCITRENIERPWIAFEAGACYGKTDGRIYPFLCDLDAKRLKESPGPLSQFTSFFGREEADVKGMLAALNTELGKPGSLSATKFDQQFRRWWPVLKSVLAETASEINTWTVSGLGARYWLDASLLNSPMIRQWKAAVVRGVAKPTKLSIVVRTEGLMQLLLRKRGPREYILLRGPAGLGKSVLLFRLIASPVSGENDAKCIVDVRRMLHDDSLQKDVIRARVALSLQTVSSTGAGRKVIVIDGIDTAARGIAIRNRKETKGVVRYLLATLQDVIDDVLRDQPVLVLISGDDKIDQTHHEIVDELQEKLNARTPGRFRTFFLGLDPEEFEHWGLGLSKTQVDASPHLGLGVFLDAPHDGPLLESDWVKMLIKRQRLIQERVSENEHAARAAPTPNSLFETAESVDEWRRKVLSFSQQQEGLETYLREIDQEKTWEWLYLLKLGSSPALIEKVWQLHDVLSRGGWRHSAALSNIVSVLTYLGAYGSPANGRSHAYFCCNLRGVLLKGKLRNAQFRATDLTEAVVESPIDLKGCHFFACLFDKTTYDNLKESQRGARFEQCETAKGAETRRVTRWWHQPSRQR